jgi:cytoplasmic iron level regulating protein YaaA (DUF328/UPF0246 family)
VLLLLPPSETKRDGGPDGSVLDLTALGFPELAAPRRAALAALRKGSSNITAAMHALRLGPSQRFEVDRNRVVRTSPVLPALDRYTGVLYDAIDAATLPDSARAFAAEHVVIHSALFGLVRADDPIPAYRLSHDSRLPGLTLRRHWAEPITRVLARRDDLVLDLRSESYVHLGPAPGAWFVRVVAPDGRALNHFNKHGKGAFVRALAESGADHTEVGTLLDWAAAEGLALRQDGDELILTV